MRRRAPDRPPPTSWTASTARWRSSCATACGRDLRPTCACRCTGAALGCSMASIDAFHGSPRRLGLPDNQRPFFQADRCRVQGRRHRGRPVSVDHGGGRVGNLELQTPLDGGGSAPGRRLALALSLALPTSTEPFEAHGLEAGLQVVAAAPLRPRSISTPAWAGRRSRRRAGTGSSTGEKLSRRRLPGVLNGARAGRSACSPS